MKNINIFYSLLFLSCIFLAGCDEPARLEGPIVIDKVELNTDSTDSRTEDFHAGTYKVYLKVEKGANPIFYSNKLYSSGETLVPMSHLQPMIDKKVNTYLDTIAIKNRQIEKLEIEINVMENQLKEKTLLIRFLTGK